MDNVNIVVHKRDVTGTRASKRLRKEGLIPGVIYGHGHDAVLSPSSRTSCARRSPPTPARTPILDVTFEDQKRSHKAIVKDMTLDSVKSVVIHVDLQEIRLDETIETTVAVHFEGEPVGVKAGGMLDESTREVTVKGIVTAIPEHLVVDVSGLDMDDTLKVSDLVVPEGIEIVNDPEEVLCSVLPPRKVEAEEGVEGVEGVEGAAAAEPEIVGKKDEETEG